MNILKQKAPEGPVLLNDFPYYWTDYIFLLYQYMIDLNVCKTSSVFAFCKT